MIDLTKAEVAYSIRKLHSKENNKCTCNKPTNLADGGYCYAIDEKGDVVRPCDVGISLNAMMNNNLTIEKL